MPKQCTVPRCKSVAEIGCRVGFHKFPLKKPELLQKWTNPIAPLKKPGWAPTSATSVCSLHFEERFLYLCNPTRISLRENAYPTIFPSFKSGSPNTTTVPELQPDNGTDPLAVTVDPLDVHQEGHRLAFFTDPANTRQDVMMSRGLEHILLSVSNSPSDCDSRTSANSSTGLRCSGNLFHNVCLSQHIKQSSTGSDSELDDIEAMLSRSSQQAGEYGSPTPSPTNLSEVVSDSCSDEFTPSKRTPLTFETQRPGKRKLTAVNGHHTSETKLRRSLNGTRGTRFRITTSGKLLDQLRKQGLREMAVDIIRDNFTTVITELLQRDGRIKHEAILPESQYQPAVRAFAVTVRFFSRRSFDYLNRLFPNSIPHPTGLQDWMPTKNLEPGYSSETLKALSQRVESFQAKNPTGKLLCSLIFGSMDLNKTVECDPASDRFWGYVNFGTAGELRDLDFRNAPMATEAVVLTVVGINDFFRVPFAYFFTAGLSTTEQSGILTDALHLLHSVRITVTNVTFDGLNVKPDMCTALGAHLTLEDFTPYFQHPDTTEDTCIAYDTAAATWLVASYLCHKKVVYYKDKEIRWQHLVELENLRNGEKSPGELSILSPLRKESCAEIFSEATVTALEAYSSLRDEEGGVVYPQLAGCQETVHFIWLLAKTLKLFNSKSSSEAGLKRPLSQENAAEILGFITEMQDYIRELRLPSTGGRIVDGPGASGFLGFLANLINVEKLYYDYIETGIIKSLPLHKLSLEHSERFFDLIRQHSGHQNSAPTQKQFYEAYRHLLLGTSHTADHHIDLGSISVLEIYSRARADSKRPLSSLPAMDQDRDIAGFFRLNPLIDNVLEYIAGYVIQQVANQLKCPHCIAALSPKSGPGTSLLRQGKPVHPSKSVLAICKAAERAFRTETTGGKSVQYYVSSIVRTLNYDSVFRQLHPLHKCSAELSPALHLVKDIAELYLRVRLLYHQRSQARRLFV